MKKNLVIFNLLIISLMVGMVSATVNFIAPINGSYTNTNILISWENGTYATSNLLYKAGTCDASLPGTLISSATITSSGSYTWDISSIVDGVYCIKIASDNAFQGEVSVTIDKTKPTISFVGAPFFGEVNKNILIEANLTDVNGIKSYILNFGDGTNSTVSGLNGNQYISINHSYSSVGKKTLTLTAVDKAGNEQIISSILVVTVSNPDWVIQLNPGANLISIPLVPNNTDYKLVFAGVKDNLDRVWAYTYDEVTKTNKWHFGKTITTGTGWSTTGDLTDIVPGRGYFVFMKSNDVFYGTGKIIQSGNSDAQPAIPPEVKLANGYNLIGLFGKTDKPINIALSSLLNVGQNNPFWYKVLDIEGSEETGNLVSGKGYWISMKHLPDSATEDYYTYYI